jgi:hypothetical protein
MSGKYGEDSCWRLGGWDPIICANVIKLFFYVIYECLQEPRVLVWLGWESLLGTNTLVNKLWTKKLHIIHWLSCNGLQETNTPAYYNNS